MVSFAYPLFPVLFILVGTWMTYQGIVLKPYISLAAVVTLGPERWSTISGCARARESSGSGDVLRFRERVQRIMKCMALSSNG